MLTTNIIKVSFTQCDNFQSILDCDTSNRSGDDSHSDFREARESKQKGLEKNDKTKNWWVLFKQKMKEMRDDKQTNAIMLQRVLNCAEK